MVVLIIVIVIVVSVTMMMVMIGIGLKIVVRCYFLATVVINFPNVHEST